jgi:hypothetical protein
MLVGKTITQLPILTAVTSAVTIPVEVSSTTYNITVDALSKSDSFVNNTANFYSTPALITKNIYIPPNVNAVIFGPTATTDPSIIIEIASGSTLTIIP